MTESFPETKKNTREIEVKWKNSEIEILLDQESVYNDRHGINDWIRVDVLQYRLQSFRSDVYGWCKDSLESIGIV